MRVRLMSTRWTLLVLCFLLAAVSLTAGQAATRKKPITHGAYDSWRSIQGTNISRDGTWLVYALVPQDGDGELVARNLRTGAEYRHPRGKTPAVTADGQFVVFTIAPLKVDMDKAKKDKKKPEEMPKAGLGILSLATGKVDTFDRVKSFKLPEESGRFVAYLLEAPEKKAEEKKSEEKKEPPAKPEEKKDTRKKEKKKEPGTELLVRELATGTSVSVPEVVEYVCSKDGGWIAYGTSSDPKTPEKDGAFARRAADGSVKTLIAGQGHYKGFAFDESGTQLAFVSDRGDYKADAPAFRLYHWTATAATATELASAATPGMRPGWAPSENGKLEFSKDGARLFFGTSLAPKADPEDAPDPVKVDIWGWKDPLLQPMQKVRAEEEKKRNYRAVIHLKEKRLVQLASEDMPEVTLIDNPNVALGVSNVPYQQLMSWDSSYDDLYAVSLKDGSRKKLVEKARFGGTLSPGGGYILTFNADDSQWYSVRVSDGQKVNLTGKLGVRFYDETNDTPEPARSYGVAGWTQGDRSVLVYDQYDTWELRPDGTEPRMITAGQGRRNRIAFRYATLDPEEKTIPIDKPLLLSATDEVTKATGYYRVTPIQGAMPAPKPEKKGRAAVAAGPMLPPLPAGYSEPRRLVIEDKQLRGAGGGGGRGGGTVPLKPKNADGPLVITAQRFDEFPNLWVCDPDFANVKKVTDANPQQADYIWGRSELIDFVNSDGKPLRAILTKPENFDPTKKYPLMVYIYEELSSGLHRYVPPSPGTSINITRFVSNGYVVLQPDIVYETGYPGRSAMKCVLPAVEKVVGMGFIDPERIGIQGHSWGGYQITYMITQTNIFRAVEAGASVSNMTSAYGGIRWGTGMSRAFQYERTQSRIGAPPWTRPLQFIENSPLFWVEQVQTPYLTIHNDEDDAVPWYQGIEFFLALRRLGKEVYMFTYNGQPHGLRNRADQKDYTIRLQQYFDHYLKGAPAPDWMEKGVPFLERDHTALSTLGGAQQ
jgi:dienelactone hydrolase